MNAWRFKLLYDGACPLCRREVAFLRRIDRHGRLAFEDIAAAGFNPAVYHATREQLLGVIHGVYPDGRIVNKLAAFRAAYNAIGWGWLLAPTGWPGLSGLADGAYEWFARHRIGIGRLFGRHCETDSCYSTLPAGDKPPYGRIFIAFIAVICLTAGIELAMGRSLLGPDGRFGWWESDIWSSENSQRLADPYSFSHLIHGMWFYGMLWLVARKSPVRSRFLWALALEAGWEILENSPLIINRYRQVTISLGYDGDSVLNSVSDILMMSAGYLFASRVRLGITLAVIFILEIGCAIWIRDNLTLNIIMLVHPIDAIKHWQMAIAPVK